MARSVVVAPPSAGWNRTQRIARVRALHGKATSSRTAAETKELVETLIQMLPADLRQQVTA